MRPGHHRRYIDVARDRFRLFRICLVRWLLHAFAFFRSLGMKARSCLRDAGCTLSTTLSSLLSSEGHLPWRTGNGVSRYRGARPRRPQALAAVLSTPIKATAPTMDAISRVLVWAKREKFMWVLLYDPMGELKRLHREIVAYIRLANLSSEIQIRSGWGEAVSSKITGQQDHRDKRKVSMEDEEDHSFKDQENGDMQVLLLSAEDSETPLFRAVDWLAKEIKASGDSDEKDSSTVDPKSSYVDQRLDEALAAPQRNKLLIENANWGHAIIEPDFVLVFGAAFTLAGFPPWSARASELYHMGLLEEVTGSRLDAVMRKYMRTRQRFGK